jgi:peptide deformylase
MGPGKELPEFSGIGVVRCVFSWYVENEVGHVVNPVIEVAEGEQDGEEGCLSIPGLCHPSRRAAYVRAGGRSGRGADLVEGEGLMARCIQHEIDHLDGHLFIDRLSGAVGKQAMRDLRESVVR